MKLIISLFVFMFAGLVPVHLKAHDTSQPKPAWWTGKHLKLTYSANDNVCREMLEYFDKKYKPTSEMFRPNHEIDGDKMEWYDDHPWMIQKWQHVKNIKDYLSFVDVAEMDTNGDGDKEIILRHTGMGRIYHTSPFQYIQIFSLKGGLDEFFAAQWKNVDSGRIINADTGMELINRKINDRDDSFVELKFHPNYDPNKTVLLTNPFYSRTYGGGIQHPFSYQGEGYIAYIQPRTDFAKYGAEILNANAHWGLIQKVTKFWDKHDMCYIAQLR